jgi:hypothetical protein
MSFDKYVYTCKLITPGKYSKIKVSDLTFEV